MFVIGLTGGIASGKTTVANLFSDKGIELVDADIVARDVVAIGSEGLAAITRYFGEDILQHDGSLDRAKLRHIIFNDEAKKNWLNNLLHPLIRSQMIHDLAATSSAYTLFVVPLLVENNLTELCDHVLVIDVPIEVQIARTMARDGVSETQAKAIIASQADRKTRLSQADSVLENDSESYLAQQVEALHQKFLELAQTAVAD